MHQLPILTVTGLCLLFLSPSLMAQTKKLAAATQHASPVRASIERGNKVYAEQCLSCHMADAGGVPNMNPSLIKSKWVSGDKNKLIQIVLQGMNTQTEIDGEIYHNVMAPHNYLTDQQIADVLTYIRNNFGNKAKAVTATEVKAVRAVTK